MEGDGLPRMSGAESNLRCQRPSLIIATGPAPCCSSACVKVRPRMGLTPSIGINFGRSIRHCLSASLSSKTEGAGASERHGGEGIVVLLRVEEVRVRDGALIEVGLALAEGD